MYEPDGRRAKKPFYNLMMFPYPSAEGLHVGNMFAFTGSDIYGRLKRMQGHDVFEPIGLDGFGIHSENYALTVGKHPMEQAKLSEKRFYKQLEMIGNGFAWDEKLETYDPKYYQWTQWIFIQLFKRGLAYRKKAPVNWCPSCKTVLADEQVVSGRCERCNAQTHKRELEQWFFRITNYAERLLKNLEKIDWSDRIKIAQRNWIGRSEGALVKFPISNSRWFVEVFTTRPDTLFGATYLVLAPEHEVISRLKPQILNLGDVENYIKQSKHKTSEERIAEGKEKTGVKLEGVKALHPITKQEIPIWVADYVLGEVGTGAIMAVPAHDRRDYEFAKKYHLPIVEVISGGTITKEAYEGEGVVINSGQFTGMSSEKAKWEITKFAGGKREVHYRLRDWLISRQRYWGPPIPMIFCNNCKKSLVNKKSKIQASKFTKGELKNPGWIAVPEKDLPVKLPYTKNFRPTGTEKSPLATIEKFYKVRCPKCNSWARRETDVSDTFLDSAWYYIGYLMAFENWKLKKLNMKSPALKKIIKKWLPVDMYIGGAEHAVLHLLYVRFLAMVLHDFGLLHFEEPFKRFRAHGLLIKEGAKMSKSRGNIVNPDDYIKNYGADALRMYLMFLGPFEQGGDFRDTGIRGITRFLQRVWKFVSSVSSQKRKPQASNRSQISQQKTRSRNIERLMHKTIKKVTEDIENLQYNTAISALMVLLNAFEKERGAIREKEIEIFLKLLAPFAPSITEELWQQYVVRDSKFKTQNSIHLQPWPNYDAALIQEETYNLVIQVNGKVRDIITVSRGIGEKDAKELALAREKIRVWIGGKEPKRVIFVPNRMINIVL